MTNKTSLWKISSEIFELEEQIIENGGELNEENEDIMSKMKELLDDKADSCINYIEYQESMIKLAKEKKAEIDTYIKSAKGRLERFNEYIINCFTRMDISSIETDLMILKVRKPSKIVHIFNEDTIPLDFVECSNTIKIDKVALKKALKSGDIDGCELVDSKNRSLQVKLKR